jgi:hypothetical protein
MTIENVKMKISALLVAAIVIGSLGVYFYGGSGGNGSGKITDGGLPYSFVNPAIAQGAMAGTTFLEEEAGMSMYVNNSYSLDLSLAKTAYKTIEEETSDYIVGSLSLPNLPETEDVHCFVHKDGWIVVYYLKEEPISKIIDWSYYNQSAHRLTKTKLQLGLEKMGGATGVTVTDAKYYNFHCPEADKWMIIIDEKPSTNVSDSFNLRIPSQFTFYENSWSHWAEDVTGAMWAPNFRINGTLINTIGTSGMTAYGTFTSATYQLQPDVFHIVTINAYRGRSRVAIVLAYKES